MGFDCGFTAIKKFKDYTVRDYLEARRYIDWLDNPWNHEEGHYPKYEDYWRSFSEYNDEYPGEPSKDLVEFIRANKDIELFGWAGWSFSDIDERLCYLLKPLDSERYTYVVEDPSRLINYLKDFISEDRFDTVVPTKSINFDEDDEILRDIDGVMLKDSDGKLIPFYSDIDEEGLVMISNLDRYWISNRFISLEAKLEMIDFNEYWVYYWRSW